MRVNLLAFCLLQRFGRALPEVLRERVMDPIGASKSWEWHGYRTSWTEVGGQRVQSVSGGAHWGGGMFIGARDHARLGLLVARGGRWGDRQILPEAWIEGHVHAVADQRQLRLPVVAQPAVPPAAAERAGNERVRHWAPATTSSGSTPTTTSSPCCAGSTARRWAGSSSRLMAAVA